MKFKVKRYSGMHGLPDLCSRLWHIGLYRIFHIIYYSCIRLHCRISESALNGNNCRWMRPWQRKTACSIAVHYENSDRKPRVQHWPLTWTSPDSSLHAVQKRSRPIQLRQRIYTSSTDNSGWIPDPCLHCPQGRVSRQDGVIFFKWQIESWIVSHSPCFYVLIDFLRLSFQCFCSFGPGAVRPGPLSDAVRRISPAADTSGSTNAVVAATHIIRMMPVILGYTTTWAGHRP